MIYGVIMAGGAGTRLWPASRQEKPKQFLPLTGQHSMIRQTADRINPLTGDERIMVITSEHHTEQTLKNIPYLRPEMVIGEPMARNTAPCIALAAARLHAADPDAVMIVLPADHHIEKKEAFLEILRTAVEEAREHHTLVTIGIQPTHPETGYGYIQAKDASHQTGNTLPVERFVEKPNLARAEEFLRSGEYMWNSGMFVWRASSILQAMEEHMPDLFTLTLGVRGAQLTRPDLLAFFEGAPAVSIDVGVMERASNVKVIPADIGWSDVGSWKAVYDLSVKDAEGNAENIASEGAGASGSATNATFIGAKNNLVMTETGKRVVLIGVEDLCVVETEDAVLVLHRDQAQRVKEAVQK